MIPGYIIVKSILLATLLVPLYHTMFELKS